MTLADRLRTAAHEVRPAVIAVLPRCPFRRCYGLGAVDRHVAPGVFVALCSRCGRSFSVAEAVSVAAAAHRDRQDPARPWQHELGGALPDTVSWCRAVLEDVAVRLRVARVEHVLGRGEPIDPDDVQALLAAVERVAAQGGGARPKTRPRKRQLATPA